ncbi:MAG TPA: MerR family DNA-binding transcriptional regulator [Longimicrobiales bacterium]
MAIGELSARRGVAASALRSYERLGLIQAERKASGHRRDPRATLRRVGCLSLDRCRLANWADRAGVRGPRARYWMGDRREA